MQINSTTSTNNSASQITKTTVDGSEGKRDFTLEVYAENGFSVLNRMINILNRRRIRIKKITATEFDEDYRKGYACFVLHTTSEQLSRTRPQIEKLIEVERTVLLENEPLNIKIKQ